MAIINTFDNTYADFVRSYWEYTCKPNTQEVLNLRAKEVLTQDFDVPDTRVKPDEQDLIWNPTPLSRRVTRTASIGHSQYFHHSRTYDFTCPPPYTGPYTANRYYRYFHDGSYESLGDPGLSSIVYPDWTLPLRSKIKDDMINLGATLAEYKQSVLMFGSAARGIRDAVRNIRKLRFMKRRSLCSVASAHLIHDYGVAPLMSDMFDSVEALRLRLQRPIIKRYSFLLKGKRIVGEATRSLGTNGRIVTKSTRKGDLRVIAYVEFDKDKLTLFTAGNPLEILWEITPFSFVVDWMIPIGDWLISFDAMKAVKRVRGTLTERDRYDQFSDVQCKGNFTGDTHWRSGAAFSSMRVIGHTRKVIDHVPLPPFPEFNVRGSISTLLNAQSLLVAVRGCRGVMPRYSRKGIIGV